MQWIAEVAAGTGIHRGSKHELGWVGQAYGCATQRHDAIFEGLPQNLENVAAELR